VGKEVMAQRLHQLSPRADRLILALNCAGLPESLIDSELFGYRKGAFTGATQAKKGLFEVADGGTLFLDEIGEMPLSIQGRLLRAISNREILPVGSTTPRPVDVRILAATNRDLEQEVAQGRFREDLYYRLNGVTIELPPLRERRSELEALVEQFVDETARTLGSPPCEVSPAAMELIRGYNWPGNIRELKNVIERATVLCEGNVIEVAHLPADRMRTRGGLSSSGQRTEIALTRVLTSQEEVERRRMLDALEANTWNQSRAAKALGMHRRTFVAKLDRYAIPRPRKGVA
jgi:transcriptional regulator with PAS, ATPase and Fis domain